MIKSQLDRQNQTSPYTNENIQHMTSRGQQKVLGKITTITSSIDQIQKLRGLVKRDSQLKTKIKDILTQNKVIDAPELSASNTSLLNSIGRNRSGNFTFQANHSLYEGIKNKLKKDLLMAERLSIQEICNKQSKKDTIGTRNQNQSSLIGRSSGLQSFKPNPNILKSNFKGSYLFGTDQQNSTVSAIKTSIVRNPNQPLNSNSSLAYQSRTTKNYDTQTLPTRTFVSRNYSLNDRTLPQESLAQQPRSQNLQYSKFLTRNVLGR